jgi:release factor glutamine methyltransferase
MKNVGELLAEFTSSFSAHHFDLPRRQAEDLLSDLLRCGRTELYLDKERILTSQESERADLWLQRRLQGEPLAYISGGVEFYGCSLNITPHVLIPRQETELLVDQIVNQLKAEETQGKVLWDLCCGSGCIAIALKKNLPDLEVCASDCSAEAIALTRANAAGEGVVIESFLGDLLSPFAGKRAHYVVCNPPYVSEEEYQVLDRGVKDYEPRGALVGGVDGLEFYHRLAQELPSHLHAHARVWFEIGYQQGRSVQEIFSTPEWIKQEVRNDWAGHPRFFYCERGTR